MTYARFTASVLFLSAALNVAAPAFAASEPNLSCVQQLIIARETTLTSAFSTFTATVQSAYATRQSALIAAWTNQDAKARKTTIESAWKSFRDTTRNAKQNVRNTRKNAWKAYRDSRKNCGGSSNTDPGGGESADTSI